jgi:membrane associated rhomboid family serine protease
MRFIPILLFTAACWIVLGLNAVVFNGHLIQYGILPRHVMGLAGILWAPFLHASVHHLAANTAPLLVLGGILCARGGAEFSIVTVFGILLGGGLTWLVGREEIHVGASGLIFCYFGYLAALAYFRRNLPTLALSLVCVLGYGGMLRGILPTSRPVSWEGHAAGLVAGITIAGLNSPTRKSNRPPTAISGS